MHVSAQRASQAPGTAQLGQLVRILVLRPSGIVQGASACFACRFRLAVHRVSQKSLCLERVFMGHTRAHGDVGAGRPTLHNGFRTEVERALSHHAPGTNTHGVESVERRGWDGIRARRRIDVHLLLLVLMILRLPPHRACLLLSSDRVAGRAPARSWPEPVPATAPARRRSRVEAVRKATTLRHTTRFWKRMMMRDGGYRKPGYCAPAPSQALPASFLSRVRL